jgi:uncharacterized SAM-binding protein YcdF (DUF218 family)
MPKQTYQQNLREAETAQIVQFIDRRLIGVLALGLLSILSLIALVSISGPLLLRSLESRFPVCRNPSVERIAGIVVLGGFHSDRIRVGGEWTYILPVTSERIVETARLSQWYPQARIVYSGGGPEAELGKKALVWLGVEPERIIVEDKSRNTAENVKFSKIIAAPKPFEKWLLVTSAHHMPRAIGAFRAAGFPVEACPAGFVDLKENVGGREYGNLAIREFIALAAYWLSGKSRELFPSAQRNSAIFDESGEANTPKRPCVRSSSLDAVSDPGCGKT